MSSPGSTASLRTANLQRVVDLVRAQGTGQPVTQADIARQTGLAPATVSNIVRELAASGLLEVEPGSGRRGTTVALARSAGLVAGIDFGHSHVAVALGDMSGSLLSEARHRLSAGHPHTEGLDCARDLLEELLAAAGTDRSSIRTFGLGLPAPMTGGVVRSSAILPGWVGVNAVDAARERFGVDVHIDNDANLGALAEHRHGVARGHDSRSSSRSPPASAPASCSRTACSTAAAGPPGRSATSPSTRTVRCAGAAAAAAWRPTPPPAPCSR